MLGLDPKSLRQAWSGIAIVLLLGGLFLVRKTLLAFIIAVMFAYVLYPLVEGIERRFSIKSRSVAVAVPFAVICAALLAGVTFAVPRVVRDKQDLTTQFENKHFIGALQATPVGKLVLNNAREILTMVPQTTYSKFLGATFRDILNLVIVPILSFFFLRDGRKICNGVVELLFCEDSQIAVYRKHRQSFERVIADAHLLILDYMRALLLLCLATLVSYGVALELLGVRYALLLALIAFPLEIVPLFGPLTSAATIIGACEFELHFNADKVPHLHLFWVIAFLVVHRIFQDYVLSPHLMHHGVNLHPLLVMFGVFAGAEIGGIGGIFLSVPILAIGRLIYYEWRKQCISPPISTPLMPSSATLVETSAMLPVEN